MNKNEIIDIIATLFREKGFYNTSIKDISERVGLKGGSLYYHIKSKEEALFKICEEGINVHLDELKQITDSDNDPKTKLVKIIGLHVDFFANNFYKTSVFLIESKALTGSYKKMYAEKRNKFESYIKCVLQEGMEKGIFRVGDLKFMTFAILGMLNWMVIWYNPDGKWEPNKLKTEFTKMILTGIIK